MGAQESTSEPVEPVEPVETLSDLADCNYTREELTKWHSNFLSKHPSKVVTSEVFVETYSNFYPHGNAGMEG